MANLFKIEQVESGTHLYLSVYQYVIDIGIAFVLFKAIRLKSKMQSRSNNRSFEKLILGIGIAVAIIASLNTSSNPETIQPTIVEASTSNNNEAPGNQKNCQYSEARSKIN